MGVAENKQLMQHIFAELLKGNTEPYLASLADDIRWTIIGTTKFSGTFHGKQAVFNELLGPVLSQIADPLTLIAHRFIAEGDHVVVEFHGQNTTKAGKAYNNTYCCVYRIAEGTWLGKEMISLSPPPRRTVRTSHLVHGSSNLRTPRGALML